MAKNDLMSLDRRSFLKGSVVAGFGVAAAGMMTACGSNATSDTPTDKAAVDTGIPESLAETVDCDVVILGGGIAGLAAAVQAGENGLDAILLEAAGDVGGNGTGVEGIFGCNTSAQQEQGIAKLHPGEIIRHELETSLHLSDGVAWYDLVSASAENYDWLVANGVTFNGVINDYGGLFDTMHWFEGGMEGVGYVPAMKDKALSYGVDIRVNAPARSLIYTDNKVTGVYAKNKDGDDIQVNAKAVVLATGGFGYNDDLLGRWGFNMERLIKCGNPMNNGDGINMGLAVGAKDCVADACFLLAPGIAGLGAKSQASSKLCFGGPFMWVNKDGNRFVNEDLGGENMMMTYIPSLEQGETFCLADSAILNAALDGEANATASGDVDARTEFEEVLATNPADNVYQADTLEELAGKFGIDPVGLADAVKRYNASCDQGEDEEFAKTSEMMVPITEPPYYMWRLDPSVMVAIGGLGTNRNMQVLNEDDAPIDGLYAIGTDGVRLYRKVYPIQIAATCCGNNVNSGRIAINNITANL